MSRIIFYDFINHAPLAKLLGHLSNVTFGAAGLAIKASSSADAKTANAVAQSINGKINALAAIATIDLSDLCSDEDALADGEGILICLFSDASDTVSAVISDPTTSYSSIAVPAFDETDKAPFGVMKVVNNSGSAFTLGTTALDTTDVTVTYTDVSHLIPGDTF